MRNVRLTNALPVVLTCATLGMTMTAHADFFQGFETDDSDWIEFGGTIDRVPSGTNGVTSATGSFHAEIVLGAVDGEGAFTRFGEYSSVWPTGGFRQLVDVYIDPAMGVDGEGWALDNALNDSDGNWTEAGGVGALRAGGSWWVMADADGGGYLGPASGGVGLEITTAGWYTIESEWVENSGDPTMIDRNTYIYNSSGTLLYSQSDPSLEPVATSGGNRYGWFLNPNGPSWPGITFPLPIDNSRLIVNDEILNVDTGEMFPSIEAAHDDADTLDGHTLEVQVPVHYEGRPVITKDITIRGGSVDEIRAIENTGASGDDRAWFLVEAGAVVDVEDIIFNGNGNLVYQAWRIKGSGSFTNCRFQDIRYNESGPHYNGIAIVPFGDGPVDVTGCTFENIGRVGVLYFGSAVSGSAMSHCVYTGKGVGDWLDYAADISAGAVVTVEDVNVTECRGVASSDGSTSAGLLVSTFFGPGTDATISNCSISECTTGIAVGFDGTDTATLTANYNSIYDNDSFGISSSSTLVSIDAENTWWGDASGPLDTVGLDEADASTCFDISTMVNADGLGNEVDGESVDYCPWLTAPATLTLTPDMTCYTNGTAGVGDTLLVSINMSAVKDFVVGGQFFLEYDNTVLDFVSASPGDAPFTLEVFEFVDEGAGTIDYGVGVPGGGPGTPVDTEMVVLEFSTLQEVCTTSGLVSFRAHVPPTRLTNMFGDEISVMTNDLTAITIDDTEPTITPPSDITVPADAGFCSADVTVPALAVSDNCGVASVINDYNGTSDASDNYPSGTTVVEWTVTDDCGNQSTVTQSIIVESTSELVLDVEFAGVLADPNPGVPGDTITRCITLELHDCVGATSEVVSAEVEVNVDVDGGGFPEPGHGSALGVIVDVPCGVYDCITAQDVLHTLQRTDDDGDFGVTGTQYVCDFTSGGTTDDSLIGGNLNDDIYVDILDFGTYVGQFGFNFGTGDTDCDTPVPHSDINGDGLVTTADFTFIQANFLEMSEDNCCGLPLAASWGGGPLERISVERLRRNGLISLIKADLNRDGWLDTLDVEVFLSGR